MIYRNSSSHVQIGTNVIQASNLSIDARFVLIYVLSRPDDYQFSSGYSLAKEIKMTPYKCQNALRELTAAGYITRTRIHRNGRLAGNEWTITEDPNSQNKVATPKEQQTEWNIDQPTVISKSEYNFNRIWNAYPASHRNDRKAALKAYTQIPGVDDIIDDILSGLEEMKGKQTWMKDEGRWIPGLARFLENHIWEEGLEHPTTIQGRYAKTMEVLRNVDKGNLF